MNSIFAIRPYCNGATWVFDDPATGLVAEAFVSGMPEMIDVLVRDIPGASEGFRLLFSTGAFPGVMGRLEWVREEFGGNWYRWAERGMEGWLCPALFKYFENAPRELYVRAEAIGAR
jgi:hypothetical protein